MLPHPDITTDKLTKVIQVVQLGRRTGLLLVERGEGINSEEGAIAFINGKITQAQAGQRRDSEALDWLYTWDICLFTFVRMDASEVRLPRFSRLDTEPVNILQNQPLALDKTKKQSIRISEASDASGQAKASPPIPRISPRIGNTNEALLAIAQAGLSRTHRQVFLLVDGVRTTADLVRLTKRERSEIEDVLYDLKGVGVIHWEKA